MRPSPLNLPEDCRHFLSHEDRECQEKAALVLISTHRGNKEIKVYDFDIGRIFFTELCYTKGGKKWIAQTAYLNPRSEKMEVEFIRFGWPA